LQYSPKEIKPYLIDFVDDNSGVNISMTDINDGIVSRGKVTGKVIQVKDINFDSLNTHFHDTIKENIHSGESLIFFCKKPEIALLGLLEQYDPNKIAFVFQEGSILCHFAVVLREKCIPAIKIGDFMHGFVDSDICTVDAEAPNKPGEERLSKG
jgi:phosphohistidine swiveling domain-containing protein